MQVCHPDTGLKGCFCCHPLLQLPTQLHELAPSFLVRILSDVLLNVFPAYICRQPAKPHLPQILQRLCPQKLRWQIICLARVRRCGHAELQEPLPSYPILSSRNIVLRLSTQEASADFFRDLVLLLEAVGATCSSLSLKSIAEAILDPVMLETGVQQDAQTLHATCL